jgi:serine/threonine protein kinase/Tfp pilus assembly protein PilF
MPLAAGSRLGPYEILSTIGAGGMGEVWKARDTRLDRIVAIKQVKPQHSARFAEEARAIAALNHPNICQIFDIGPDYLVLEYIEGRPLSGGLDITEVLRVALQIADALESAHRRGIIHRDLKPANILLTDAGSAKLLDFGLAKLVSAEAGSRTETIEGAVAGTAAYMAPEQAVGKHPDQRSDIFSFGAVLYELISGTRPFAGNSVAEVLSGVLRDDPPPLHTSPALQQIVMKCLAKSPADRFQTAADLKSALEHARMPGAPRPSSIAVLPFTNMSGDKENEFFSDGLTEDIINALTQVPGVQVTARTSAFSFRGKDSEIQEIARRLDVEYILEGSVRKAGSRIRVTAQLIRAANQFHVWSERYDRELTDVFAIQDEISEAIAGHLKMSLAPSSPRRIPKVAAYEAFLQSRYHWQKLNPEGFARSLEWVERAIALDPEYADPYVGRAAYYFSVAWYGGEDPRRMMPKVRESALKALSLSQDHAEAHATLGSVMAVFDYDWAGAAQHFQLAMTLEKNFHVMLPYANWFLRPLGRLEEALTVFVELRRRDPLSAATSSELAHVLLLMRRYDEAAEAATHTLDLEADHQLALYTLITAHVQQGRFDEAIALAGRDVQLRGRRWAVPLTYLGYAYAAAGRLNDARAVLDEMLALPGDVNALALANIYCALGEIDTAVDWVDKAIEQRHPLVAILKNWPIFDGMRRHPRYPELLQKMKL